MGHLTKITNEIINAKEKGPNHENIKSMFSGMYVYKIISDILNICSN